MKAQEEKEVGFRVEIMERIRTEAKNYADRIDVVCAEYSEEVENLYDLRTRVLQMSIGSLAYMLSIKLEDLL